MGEVAESVMKDSGRSPNGRGKPACFVTRARCRAKASSSVPLKLWRPRPSKLSAKSGRPSVRSPSCAPRRIVRVGVGDLVYRGDTIPTEADGAVGITFADGTAFDLSAAARLVLNEFVCDPAGTPNSALFSLVQGAFAFVAGKVAKTGGLRTIRLSQASEAARRIAGSAS